MMLAELPPPPAPSQAVRTNTASTANTSTNKTLTAETIYRLNIEVLRAAKNKPLDPKNLNTVREYILQLAHQADRLPKGLLHEQERVRLGNICCSALQSVIPLAEEHYKWLQTSKPSTINSDELLHTILNRRPQSTEWIDLETELKRCKMIADELSRGSEIATSMLEDLSFPNTLDSVSPTVKNRVSIRQKSAILLTVIGSVFNLLHASMKSIDRNLVSQTFNNFAFNTVAAFTVHAFIFGDYIYNGGPAMLNYFTAMKMGGAMTSVNLGISLIRRLRRHYKTSNTARS